MNRPLKQRHRGDRGHRLSRAMVAITMALMAVSMHQPTWGDGMAAPPMPPLPEDVQAGSTIQPASLEVATPLSVGGSRNHGASASLVHSKPSGPMGNWSVLAAMASAFVVLAAFRFWQTRRTSRELPSDVFEILGEAPLGNQHAVRVVRFGPRTLLVGISSAGCQTLAALEDPQVTERIVSACIGNRMARPSRVPPRQAPAAVREVR